MSTCTKSFTIGGCIASPDIPFSCPGSSGKKLSGLGKYGDDIAYMDDDSLVAIQAASPNEVALIDFSGVTPVVNTSIPGNVSTDRILASVYKSGSNKLVVFEEYGSYPNYSHSISFFKKSGMISNIDLGPITGSWNIYSCLMRGVANKCAFLKLAWTLGNVHTIYVMDTEHESISGSGVIGNSSLLQGMGNIAYVCNTKQFAVLFNAAPNPVVNLYNRDTFALEYSYDPLTSLLNCTAMCFTDSSQEIWIPQSTTVIGITDPITGVTMDTITTPYSMGFFPVFKYNHALDVVMVCNIPNNHILLYDVSSRALLCDVARSDFNSTWRMTNRESDGKIYGLDSGGSQYTHEI